MEHLLLMLLFFLSLYLNYIVGNNEIHNLYYFVNPYFSVIIVQERFFQIHYWCISVQR